MRITTVMGTRPEIIRLSRLIPLLDDACDHTLVYTGQNSDPLLSDVFFEELSVRGPDVFLGVDTSSPGRQIGGILQGCERVFADSRPDRVLALGDTNSALSVFIAKRMGIPVYHMEAGNRCYDDRVPEEVNRRVVDTCSDVLMPYTGRSRENLLREGIPGERILVTGNPIREVLEHAAGRVSASGALERLGVEPGRFFLATAHRAENVDVPGRLAALASSFERISSEWGMPVIVSTHPRTRARLGGAAVDGGGPVRYVPPLGLADFVRLEGAAACVLTDSGTVQEECCIMRVPNVTLRDVTERPETVECGSNILSGVEPEDVLRCLRMALGRPRDWTPPAEYMALDVSSTAAAILLSGPGV